MPGTVDRPQVFSPESRLSMTEQISGSTHYFFQQILDRPGKAITGLLLGVALPDTLISVGLLALLVTIDTMTGRAAAYRRGEQVTSGTMRAKILTKIQGYMLFLLTAALASGAIPGGKVVLKGAIGLLSAIEFFSISENMFDLDMLPFDPRKVPLFRSVVSSVRLRKRAKNNEQGSVD
jgi:hypothetical protein